MESKVMQVETVGFIPAPHAVSAETPEQAAKGENCIDMIFDNDVLLTVSHDRKIKYPKGTHPVPMRIAKDYDWYLKAHNVREYRRSVAVTAEVPGARSGRRSK